ncbi:MAG TPA: peptidase U32 family protein [Candidatus Nanoarchaeia archaeon]|nr:peptidase U32 family protein [Candidatus Nanoarchaeia archaeon]
MNSREDHHLEQHQNHKMELLLPAGNWNCLRAAVENGADAVYFGVKEFNARRRADNFELKEVAEIVDYCHKNGVRAYCTLNILIKNSEINRFFEVIKQVYLTGVDAVIIQHISFIPLLKRNFPGMEVHLSTQAAITNTYFYELIKEADKIVLPREFSKEEINNFIQKTKLPVEIFVQGAQCFSYSGKCLFSSFLGGRSGNRGLCAQPCRRKYNESYLLSMKDLCLLEKLPEIIEIGVSSLKIEGRLRSERYVTAAAKAYRSAIDSYYAGKFQINKELFKEMELSFNREFTPGYFTGETEVGKAVVSLERSMGRGLFLGVMEENNWITLKQEISVGDGLGIWFKDKVDGALLRKMEKDGKEIKTARAGEKVKLFIRAPVGTKVYLTSSTKLLSKITFAKNKPLTIPPRSVGKIKLPVMEEEKSSSHELLVKVYSVKAGEEALCNDADKVFYNIFATDFTSKFGAFVPRILNDEEVEKAVKLINTLGVKDVLVGDLGVYDELKNKKGLNLYLDYSSNIFNDYDMDSFANSIPIISPELSFQELRQFQHKNFAVLAHGRGVLMNTKYPCLPSQLKDEKNYVFLVRKEHTYWQILNSVELGLFEEVKKLREIGVGHVFLDLEKDVGNTVKIYRALLSGKVVSISKKGYTKGHWEKGVE